MTNNANHKTQNTPEFKPEKMGTLAFKIFNAIMESHKLHPKQSHFSIQLSQVVSFDQKTEPAIINKTLGDATDEILYHAIIFKEEKATQGKTTSLLLVPYFSRFKLKYGPKTLEVTFNDIALSLV